MHYFLSLASFQYFMTLIPYMHGISPIYHAPTSIYTFKIINLVSNIALYAILVSNKIKHPVTL